MNTKLELLSRPGCHLCDEARIPARRAAAGLGVTLVEVNIDLDDALTAEFGLRIPVIRWRGGPVLAEGADIDARSLLEAARRSSRR